MKLVCPNCGNETEHKILSSKVMGNGIEYVLQCLTCKYTYKKYIENEKIRDLKVVWSWKDKSEIKKISLFENDIVSVGDEMEIGGITSKITAIDSKGKRVKKARVGDIDTLWAKRFDRVVVKISVNKGTKTVSSEMVVNPYEDFYIGDLIDIKNTKCVIHRIKVHDRFITRGSAKAKDIVRIYAKEIKER